MDLCVHKQFGLVFNSLIIRWLAMCWDRPGELDGSVLPASVSK